LIRFDPFFLAHQLQASASTFWLECKRFLSQRTHLGQGSRPAVRQEAMPRAAGDKRGWTHHLFLL